MDFLLQLLPNNIVIGIIISIFINIFIAVAGIIPSTFLTAANVVYFGFQLGLIVSIAGEAIGAIISFVLYRNGIKAIENKFGRYTNLAFIEKLKSAEGIEAIILVLFLRVLPFVPSGLVTLAASISKMRAMPFAIASTIGKIPALMIEAYSVYSFLGWKLQYQISVTIAALSLLIIYLIWKKQ